MPVAPLAPNAPKTALPRPRSLPAWVRCCWRRNICMMMWLSRGSGRPRNCGGSTLKIAWRTAGFRQFWHARDRERRAEQIPRKRHDEKVRRGPACALDLPSRNCVLSSWNRERLMEWGTTTTTYVAPLPKQLDQLPKVVVVRPRCGLNPHEHGLCSLHPFLEFVHRDHRPRKRKG